MNQAVKNVSVASRLRGITPNQAVPVMQVKPNHSSPLTQKATPLPRSESKTRWWHSIGRSSKYSSFVFLGSGLVFMERLERVAEPVVFLWKHLGILARALFYLAVPAAATALLLKLLPELSVQVLKLSWFSAAYLTGLYISCAFGILLTGFLGRSLLKGFRSNIDSLADRGREAFSTPEKIESESKEEVHSIKPSLYGKNKINLQSNK